MFHSFWLSNSSLYQLVYLANKICESETTWRWKVHWMLCLCCVNEMCVSTATLYLGTPPLQLEHGMAIPLNVQCPLPQPTLAPWPAPFQYILPSWTTMTLAGQQQAADCVKSRTMTILPATLLWSQLTADIAAKLFELDPFSLTFGSWCSVK